MENSLELPHLLFYTWMDPCMVHFDGNYKQSFKARNSAKLCYIYYLQPSKFQGQKPRPQEIAHDFFSIPGISTSFLIHP